MARKDLDGLLRSRIQYHDDAAAYVYAGSEPSMMRELFDDRERPLFGQADPLALGPLPLEDVLADAGGALRRRGPRPGRGARRARALRRRPPAAHDAARLPARRAGRRSGRAGTARPAQRVVDDALARTQPGAPGAVGPARALRARGAGRRRRRHPPRQPLARRRAPARRARRSAWPPTGSSTRATWRASGRHAHPRPAAGRVAAAALSRPPDGAPAAGEARDASGRHIGHALAPGG